MAEQTQVEILLKLRDEVTSGLGKIDNSIKGLDTTTSKLKASWVNLSSQIFVLQRAFRVLSGGIKAVVGEAIKQEDAINRLNSALQLQGTFSSSLSMRYQDLAKDIQRSTRFADDSVLAMMDTLVTMGNVTPTQMERVTKATVDFAAATGRDLGSAGEKKKKKKKKKKTKK